ncbi:type I CRISPR-associated protein Cas7, partial [Thermodesulfovibrionales bacterium]|nr:type I CRISPR-associated protein Cas7 [Thermodesulfovibrionales bacterium]
VPYACIAAYGVVNEIAARSTQLSDADVSLLLEGLWKGTEGLISRSKMGHQPLMLIRITYKDGYRIGDLAGRLRLVSEKEDIQIRSVNDYVIDITSLIDSILSAGGEIEGIEVKQDNRLKFSDNGKEGVFAEMERLKDISIHP